MAIAEGIKSSKEKNRILIEKTLATKEGVIYLNEEQVKLYLTSHPRNYDLAVLFINPQNELCQNVLGYFKHVSQAYKQKFMYLPKRKKNDDEIQKPIFFIAVEFTNDQSLIDQYDLKTLPTFLISDSLEIQIIDKYKRKQYLDTYSWRITKIDGVINEYIILNWMNRVTGYDLKINQSLFQFLFIMMMLLLVILILGAVYFLFQKVILNPLFWIVCCFLVFFVFGGGAQYFIDENVPFFGYQENVPQFYIKGTRQSYGIESFIFTGSALLFCLFLFLAAKFLRARNLNFFVQGIFVVFFICLSVAVITNIEYIFKQKNFYNPAFLPPSYYIRGGINKDKMIIQ